MSETPMERLLKTAQEAEEYSYCVHGVDAAPALARRLAAVVRAMVGECERQIDVHEKAQLPSLNDWTRMESARAILAAGDRAAKKN